MQGCAFVSLGTILYTEIWIKFAAYDVYTTIEKNPLTIKGNVPTCSSTTNYSFDSLFSTVFSKALFDISSVGNLNLDPPVDLDRDFLGVDFFPVYFLFEEDGMEHNTSIIRSTTSNM